jgi:hypothetical protein
MPMGKAAVAGKEPDPLREEPGQPPVARKERDDSGGGSGRGLCVRRGGRDRNPGRNENEAR